MKLLHFNDCPIYSMFIISLEHTYATAKRTKVQCWPTVRTSVDTSYYELKVNKRLYLLK